MWLCNKRVLSVSYIAIIFLTISTQQTSSSSSSQSKSSRHLQEVDGITACNGCTGGTLKCVGRTVVDTNCHGCATGQEFWPCNLKKECWCWDTSGPRDSGDEDTTACSGCGRDSTTETCVGNQNSLTPVKDEECNNCMNGQSYWPCSDQDLCWCWDTTKPKKPPAPISGYPVNENVDVCDFFTRDMFDLFAPNSTFPYTYEGLCGAIMDYNKDHTEKVFKMGSKEMILAELAAFLGNTAHESDDFEAGREYLACGDRKEVDGKVYCKPCTNDLFDWEKFQCSVSMVDQNAPYNSYCQPGFEPPEGCVCDTITQVEESGPLAGYVEASKVFYGRGAIQLSWNYNYIRASFALTGEASTFCNDPEQVVTNPKYAWGTAIFFWMESIKEGTTCHKEALNRDFGGTLNVINGGLECPAYKGGWHHDAIKMRINRYCHAASLLGIDNLSSFGGCAGLTDSFEECLGDGSCRYCEKYSGSPTEESGFSPEEAAKTSAPNTSAPTSAPAPAPVTSSNPRPKPKLTPRPTILFSETKTPTMRPSTKAATSSPIMDTGTPTVKPPPKPTNDPSASPVTNLPTSVPSEFVAQPTYMPTTSEPTMGPCSGKSCPAGFCRSAWGFCGDDSGYCNDSAIWSPTCTVTEPPSLSPQITDAPASPSNTPISSSTLNDVFGASYEADAGEDSPLSPPTPLPTSMPTGNKTSISLGPKPTGGRKPVGGKLPTVGGKPKPATISKSPPTHEPTTSPTPLPTSESLPTQQPSKEPTPFPTSLPTLDSTSAPTQRPSKEPIDLTNLSYPENTFFCGNNWEDVNESCSIRCPSSKTEDCPEGMFCFAFTQCNDKLAKDVTTDSIDGQIDDTGGSTALDVTTPAKETNAQEGCTGTPCPFENECRSEYGFCGTSFIYCNVLSSWKLENCGLYGVDASGETHLCDVEVFECSNGKAVHRNPAEGCEYFECPSMEESAVTSSIFNVPGPSPLVPLPGPTLPTITKPTSQQLSTAFLPTGSTTSTSSSEPDSSNGLAILLGSKDKVVDDTEESTSKPTEKPVVSPNYNFGSFKADEWLFVNSNSAYRRHDLARPLFVCLFTVQLLFVFN